MHLALIIIIFDYKNQLFDFKNQFFGYKNQLPQSLA
jgi:hypothetical protein